MTVKDEWWQLEFEDDSALSGKVVARYLELAGSCSGSPFVAFDRVEGPVPQELHEDGVMVVAELIAAAAAARQFDWGNFYFTSSFEAAETALDQPTYLDALRVITVLVRAVDDGYLYFYGRDPEILTALRAALPKSVLKIGSAADLEFPE